MSSLNKLPNNRMKLTVTIGDFSGLLMGLLFSIVYLLSCTAAYAERYTSEL